MNCVSNRYYSSSIVNLGIPELVACVAPDNDVIDSHFDIIDSQLLTYTFCGF